MLRIRTLGVVDLEESATSGLSAAALQPKRLALLVYLAVQARAGYQRRDSLTAMFWPELDTPHARAALRKALHYIRGYAGPDVVLTRGDDEVRIDPTQCWCDAREMRDLAATGALDQAVALYRGDFLQGLHVSDAQEFESWLDRERFELRRLAAESALKIAETARASGQLGSAVQSARRAVELAPLESRPTHVLLELLDAVGDRPAAVAHFRRFAHRLQQELEIEPDEVTRRLVAKWRVPGLADRANGQERGVRARHGRNHDWDPGLASVPALPSVPESSDGGGHTNRAAPGESREIRPRDRASLRRLIAGSTAVVVLFTALLVGFERKAPVPVAFTVLADVAGSAPEEVRRVVKSLLQGALEQEMTLSPISQEELRIGLVQMRRSDTTRIDDALARELAVRGGMRSAVLSTLDQSGDSYAFAARVVDSESGATLASARVAATHEDGLIAATSRVAAQLSAQLQGNQRLGDLEAREAPFDATTASYEAFRLWSLGARETQRTQFAAAEQLLRAAVVQDPGFMNAWVSLANVLNGTGQRDSMLAVLARIDSLEDRNPNDARRRRWISALLRSQYPEALVVAEEVLVVGPGSAGFLNNRSIILAAMGRDQDAINSGWSAVRASRFGPSPLHVTNLVGFLASAGQPLVARRALDSLRQVCGSICDTPLVRGSQVTLDILLDDWDAVAETAESRRAPIAVSTLQMRRGAARAAWETLAAAGKRGASQRDAELVVALVAPHAVRTPSGPPRASTVDALWWHGVWEALRGDTASARRDMQRLRELLPHAYRGAAPEFIAAVIAARAEQWEVVIETLGPVTRGREYGRWQQDAMVGPVPIRWLMAEAYQKVGKSDSAILMYERVLKPDEGNLHHLAMRGLVWSFAQQRLASLRSDAGFGEVAERHAVAFTNAFTEPDQELVPLLKEFAIARAEPALRLGSPRQSAEPARVVVRPPPK